MVLFYDDDCGLCTRAVSWLRVRTPGLVVEPLGTPQAAVLLVTDNGRELSGAPAVAAVLRSGTDHWRHLGRLLQLPVLRTLAAGAYRVVAANRHRVSRLLGWQECEVPQSEA